MKEYYSLGSDSEEQQRLEKQQTLYDDARYLTFKKTDTVCEVGCGAGANLWIASQLTEGRFIGVDIQEEQITACCKKAVKLGLKNVDFYQAPGQQLPLKDASVDMIFCRLVLIHVPDCQHVIKEMCRVTKPGGRVIAIEPAVETYATSKSSLLKCFRARSEYVYRTGFGTVDIARQLKSLFRHYQLEDVKIVKHKIEVTGENREKLIGLLNNWFIVIKSVEKELLEQKKITQKDLIQAEREVHEITPMDYIYQELWIAEGIKS